MKSYVHTVDEKKIKLHCINSTIWPPPEAFIKENLETMRQNGDLSDERYEAHKVWVKTCSKVEMDSICTMCPLSQFEARVRVRATGRYTLRKIGHVEASKILPANIFIQYEK